MNQSLYVQYALSNYFTRRTINQYTPIIEFTSALGINNNTIFLNYLYIHTKTFTSRILLD